jgi:hypothetical protein
MSHRESTYITHLSNEHSSWTRGIAFYRDEIKILIERLDALSCNKSSTACSTLIEEYRKQITDHQHIWESLEKDIQSNYKLIESDIEIKDMHISNSTMAQADSLRNRYIMAENDFNAFRHAFNRFLCDNMDVVLK